MQIDDPLAHTALICRDRGQLTGKAEIDVDLASRERGAFFGCT
jgi:hypothetical protein